jgi:uncharacterized membrane protein YeaQ/YmgE (transglycosylase-associated protein family)
MKFPLPTRVEILAFTAELRDFRSARKARFVVMNRDTFTRNRAATHALRGSAPYQHHINLILGGTIMYLLWEIIIGILAGFLAGQIVKGSGMGILIDLLVGIVGSIIGGWIFGLLGLASYGLIGQLVMATVGAIVLLLIVKAIKRA